MNVNMLMVKNMVCRRCVMAVEDTLKAIGIAHANVRMGEVELERPLSETEKDVLGRRLEQIGFELIDNRNGSLVEQIKQLCIQRARNNVSDADAQLKLSALLANRLHHEYTYLSSLFSGIESRTIENYYIEQRIEYVKELLVYDELSLSEIAMKLEYSSTAHLSAQFKKVTGLNPSHYKKLGTEKRKGLDQV